MPLWSAPRTANIVLGGLALSQLTMPRALIHSALDCRESSIPTMSSFL